MFLNSRNASRRGNRKSTAMTYGVLEGKRLLAGNVTVFDGDHLFIRGDQADNQIEIVGNDDGTISVIGKNGTTVNKKAEPFIVTGTATEEFVDIQEADYDGGLRYHGGPGNDTLIVEQVGFSDVSLVYGGTGDDAVGTVRSIFGDRLVMQTFSGDDSISLDTVDVAGDVFLMGLDGNDTIGVDNAVVEGNAIVVGGEGSDRIALNGINRTRFQNDLLVIAGDGEDYISAKDIHVDGSAGLYGGNGNDEVSLDFQGTFFEDQSLNVIRVGGQGGEDSFTVNVSDSQMESIRLGTFESEGIEGNPANKNATLFDDLIVSGARQGTVAELVRLTPELSTLEGALESTVPEHWNSNILGFVDRADQVTAFAPTDAAFEKLPNGLLAGLSNEELGNVLLFHLGAGFQYAGDIVEQGEVETLFWEGPGSFFSFPVDATDDGVLLNDEVTLQLTDIRAKNGVVHVINEVLIPNNDAS